MKKSKSGLSFKAALIIYIYQTTYIEASDYDDFYVTSRNEARKQVEGAERFPDAVRLYLEKRYEETK